MIEIDILPASTDTKGADSFLIRFGTFSYNDTGNEQKIILIDGGYSGNAEAISNHLVTYYNSKIINLLICTHPDADHVNGLVSLLEDESIRVEKALIHDPWKFKYSINRKSSDNRTTPNSIENKLDQSLSALDDLITKLENRKVKIVSPFTGYTEFDGVIKVLGPSQEYYTTKVTQFPGMPDYEASFGNYNSETVTYNEKMEHFLEDGKTSARNASSAIILFEYEGFKVLFTGDAGVESLINAIDYAEKVSLNLKDLNYMQIPHHGSAKNLSKEITKKIVAEKYFVSAPSNSDDHPSKLLINYFQNIQHNKVFHVSNNTLCINHGVDFGRNWSAADNCQLFNSVQVLKKV